MTAPRSGARQALSPLLWLIVAVAAAGSVARGAAGQQACRAEASNARLNDYLTRYGAFEGWLSEVDAVITMQLLKIQEEMCITGSVGEIGVHHGKYALALASAKKPGEKMVVMDVFEDQALNTDGSGRGSRDMLRKNAASLGFDLESDFVVIKGDSALLSAQDFENRKIPRFRFFSVDGAHHYKAALQDLRLALSWLEEGGIISLDDFFNRAWLGVTGAAYRFMSTTPEIAPIVAGCNKLHLAHVKYQERYVEALRRNPCANCSYTTTEHVSRHTMKGYKVCRVWQCGACGSGPAGVFRW